LVTWNAQSKDHGVLCPHKLTVYALGIRLMSSTGAWIPASTLRQYMSLASYSSASSVNASASVQNNVNYWTVGGGANIQWGTKGQLLYENHPSDNGAPGWYAASKSHRSIESCPMTVYAIGITKGYIPGFGNIAINIGNTSPMQYFMRSPGTYANGGPISDSYNSAPGWATTCMGVKSTSDNGRGRLITQMKYNFLDNWHMNATSGDKDHFVGETGWTYTYLIEAKKQ
jgi:hypothetical protein